jgi:hypothetical protein
VERIGDKGRKAETKDAGERKVNKYKNNKIDNCKYSISHQNVSELARSPQPV